MIDSNPATPRARRRLTRGRAVLPLLLWLLGASWAVPGDPTAEPPAAQTAPDEAVIELVDKGTEARRQGRLEEAIGAFREARRLEPDRYEVLLLLADTLRLAARGDEAAEEYRGATALDPGRPEGYAGLAMTRRAVFDYAGAAKILEEALERVTREARDILLVGLGEVRRRQGRLDEAASLFARGIGSKGSKPSASAGLAHLAEQRGSLLQAVRWWDRYLRLRPDDDAAAMRRQELEELRVSIEALRTVASDQPSAPLLGELGRLLLFAGDASGAAEAYRRAATIAPDNPGIRRGLASALRDAGELEPADAELERLLKLRPSDGVGLHMRSAVARARGDLAAEEAAWIALLRARPDDRAAVRGFSGFLERSDPGALSRMLEALGPAGSDPAQLRLRATLLAIGERWEESSDVLYEVFLLDPTDPRTHQVANEIFSVDPHLLRRLAQKVQEELGDDATDGGGNTNLVILLARLNEMNGRGDRSLALVERAAASDPQSPIAASALAAAHQRSGKPGAEVLARMERAVALDPGRLTAQVDLALTLLKSGRPEESEKVTRSALERLPESAELRSLLGASLADRGDLEGAAEAYRTALLLDPADNFGLARGQYPLILAALGRQVEARRALEGSIPPVPEALYQEAWAFVRDSTFDPDFNREQWLAWKHRYRGDLKSPLDAYRAISTMLASLDDPYTRLRDPEETAAVYLTRHGNRTYVDRLGRNRPHSRTVETEEMPGDVGYIRLSNLTDPNVVAAVRRALEQMGHKKEIILDLRGNTGGLTRSADAIGDLLVGPGENAGVDIGPTGPTEQTTGGEGAVTDAPVTVLVDGQTGSAAERLARTLEMTGRAALLGDATHGKGRYQTSRVLPGGVTILVSAGEMLGPDGRPIQGRGLQPQRRQRR